ncbi:asparagine synthase (glutamine-hydrolysing) [Luteibacter sp. 329MFSha]|nr:asparagine synthase (glutamine-hydrolysing) [Luteibacter sp. 329MFSha]
MIKAEIALSDLSFDPMPRADAIVLGGSRIVPCRHPMLETLCIRAPGQWFLVTRERRASDAPLDDSRAIAVEDVDEARFHALYQASLLWPLDYVMIEVAQAGHRLRVRAGVLGVLPVYARVLDDRVSLSWNSADLAAGPALLDLEVASHQLALRTLYAARQLYTGVVMLTERASLHVEPGRARFRYPEAVPAAAPSHDDGEDTLPAFAEALQRAVHLRPWRDGSASLELSGGMDSATVATALTRQHAGIDSKGILLDGQVRAPQVHRRRMIAERLGLSDHTVDIADWPPDVGLAQPTRPYGFCRDFYLEACEALWTSARERGRDVLFTGIGGDELFPAYIGEVSTGAVTGPEWSKDARGHAEAIMTSHARAAARSRPLFDAPDSPVPVTSLLAQACRAPDLLAHGQWPVNPLSDPHLAAFCHRLPRSSREGREVMRRYLESHLGTDVFPKGYLKETFADVLPPLIARQAASLATQLRECALADMGLVDRNAVLDLLETIVRTRSHPATSAFASFLWLERLARQGASGWETLVPRMHTPDIPRPARTGDHR